MTEAAATTLCRTQGGRRGHQPRLVHRAAVPGQPSAEPGQVRRLPEAPTVPPGAPGCLEAQLLPRRQCCAHSCLRPAVAPACFVAALKDGSNRQWLNTHCPASALRLQQGESGGVPDAAGAADAAASGGIPSHSSRLPAAASSPAAPARPAAAAAGSRAAGGAGRAASAAGGSSGGVIAGNAASVCHPAVFAAQLLLLHLLHFCSALLLLLYVLAFCSCACRVTSPSPSRGTPLRLFQLTGICHCNTRPGRQGYPARQGLSNLEAVGPDPAPIAAAATLSRRPTL